MTERPYIIGVWQPSLIAAAEFINGRGFGDNVIQFVPDTALKHGFWIMLRLTSEQTRALRAERRNFLYDPSEPNRLQLALLP